MPRPARYVLHLYVAGTTPNSVRAIANVRRLCEQRLRDRHALTIVDAYQQPDLARRDGIVALPTLIRRKPEPTGRLVGDMADAERILLDGDPGGRDPR